MIDLKDIPPLLDEATAMLKRDNDAADRVFIGMDPASGSDFACKATFRGDTLISLVWSDDKPDERADRHISTGPSDLGADGKPIIRRA